MFFKDESIPRFLQVKPFKSEQQAKQSFVNYLISRFEDETTDLGDIEKDDNIRQYLGISNYQQIYKNCFKQYCAANTLPNMIRRYLSKAMTFSLNFCPCPIFDWMKFQEIDISMFCESFYSWFFQLTKRNTLLLQGAPNAGKTYFLSQIWRQFPIHTRLLQDGLFTFANLVNSDCALWEEPLIIPDNVDMCKLVLEGQSDIAVAIKNQNAQQRLNKRVPVLITTNKDISTYCSSDSGALNVHVFKYMCPNAVTSQDICKNAIHVCHDTGTDGHKSSSPR